MTQLTDKKMSDKEYAALTASGFEKRGGYASSPRPVARLPKVPGGPAPGAKPQPDEAVANSK